MRQKTCFFIGHHDAPETILPLIYEAVERHIIEYGVSEFVIGHYGRFDALAAHAVREAKKHYPEVMLTLLIPYYPYNNDTSDYLICYDRGQIGKTRDYVELAKQLVKHRIENLAKKP